MSFVLLCVCGCWCVCRCGRRVAISVGRHDREVVVHEGLRALVDSACVVISVE